MKVYARLYQTVLQGDRINLHFDSVTLGCFMIPVKFGEEKIPFQEGDWLNIVIQDKELEK